MSKIPNMPNNNENENKQKDKNKFQLQPKMPKWLLLILILMFVFGSLNLYKNSATFQKTPAVKIPFSELLISIKSNRVEEIIISGDTATGYLKYDEKLAAKASKDGKVKKSDDKTKSKEDKTDKKDKRIKFESIVSLNDNFFKLLEQYEVKTEIKKPSSFGFGTILNIITTLFIIFLLLSFIKAMKGDKIGAITKPRLKLVDGNKKKITFKDVAGIDEAKADLEEVVDFLKSPTKFSKIGGRIPKGVLLVGSPGTGKTLLAKAIAGEANVPFFSISGSDFVELFVGVGASRVRALFEQGKKAAPCIIFIDEIDAVGRHRGAGYGGGSDEREQTLNQLLVEMDGFESNEGIVIIAATNRADVLDEALLRPGRFDRQIYVPLPDLKGREKILAIHASKVKMDETINLSNIARGTPGFSGAELANLINESALLAARCNHKVVMQEDIEEARDKIMMGAERRSTTMRPEELKLTAYHEAGHAICALKTEHTDPIHKATIIPRGSALGMVQQLPLHDKVSLTISEVKSQMTIYFGGRVAEEIFFGPDKITAGASSDIKGATYYARNSIVKWGFSKLGPIYFEEANMGYHESDARKNISDETARKIDAEIALWIDEAINKTRQIITKYKKETIAIAEALLEYETLTGDELKAIVDGTFDKKSKPLPKNSIMKMAQESAKLSENTKSDINTDKDDKQSSDKKADKKSKVKSKKSHNKTAKKEIKKQDEFKLN